MRALRTCLALLLGGVMAIGATACGADTAAKVNGEVITKAQWEARFDALQKQGNFDFGGPGGEATMIEVKQRALDELIDEVLVEQEASRRGVNVSKTDVQRAIDGAKQGFDSDEAFNEALKSVGINPDDLEGYFRTRLTEEALISTLDTEVVVTDGEIEAYYVANKRDMRQPRTLTVAHILFDENDRKTADEVLRLVLDGAEFGGMSRQYSMDQSTRDNGGEISSQLPLTMEVQAAAESLDPGEVYYKVVKDPVGLHIVKLLNKTEEREMTLGEATETIRLKLSQDRGKDSFYTLVQDLRAQADIEIVMQELKVPGSQPK